MRFKRAISVPRAEFSMIQCGVGVDEDICRQQRIRDLVILAKAGIQSLPKWGVTSGREDVS